MENLKSKIKTIETALHDSDWALQILEDRTRAGIGTEVKGMHSAVAEGDRRIEHIRSEVKTLLKAIDRGSLDSVDLTPQLNWLSPKVEAVVNRFRTAESHADAAIEHAMSGQSHIIDVGQRVEVNKSQLEVAQLEGERLASDAESQLRTSERRMANAQARIEAKEREIQGKRWKARSLRVQKRKFEGEISSLQRENIELKALKRQYESEVRSRRSNHVTYRAEVTNSDRVLADISIIKKRALSASVNVQNVQKEMQKTKEQLDHCSAALNSHSLELRTKSSFIDTLLTQKRKRKREFDRQKKMIEQLSSTLASIQSEVPKLLPSQETKFLDLKPWEKPRVCFVEHHDTMPAVCQRRIG